VIPLRRIATLRAGLLPGQIGMLLAIGSRLYMVDASLGQLAYEPLWMIAILGALVLGLGLVWAGYSLWSSKETLVLQPTG
jgi:hypothetical protein